MAIPTLAWLGAIRTEPTASGKWNVRAKHQGKPLWPVPFTQSYTVLQNEWICKLVTEWACTCGSTAYLCKCTFSKHSDSIENDGSLPYSTAYSTNWLKDLSEPIKKARGSYFTLVWWQFSQSKLPRHLLASMWLLLLLNPDALCT